MVEDGDADAGGEEGIGGGMGVGGIDAVSGLWRIGESRWRG